MASVDVSGSAQPAIRVDVDLAALNAMDLTPEQPAQCAARGQCDLAAGISQRWPDHHDGDRQRPAQTPEQFADLVIAVHDGTPIRLRDVANVYQGAEDSYQAAWFNGKPSIGIDMLNSADANVIDTVDRDQGRACPRCARCCRPARQLTPYYDGTPDGSRFGERSAAHPADQPADGDPDHGAVPAPAGADADRATAVPLSLAGAFVAMYMFDYTLDNMSLLALVIALAFVVDDAIVVIENIIRHVDEGDSRLEATLKGAREIGFTIVSITLSLIAVFIPLLFAPSMIGVFFREFTVTLIAAIAVSAVVSLTLTPSLCGMFLRPEQDRSYPFRRCAGSLPCGHAAHLPARAGLGPSASAHGVAAAAGSDHHHRLPVHLCQGRPVSGSGQRPDLGAGLGRLDLSFEDMKQRQERITQLLMSDPAVEYVGSRLGSRRGSATGSFSIQLKPLGQGREQSTQLVLARLSAKADKFPAFELRLRAHQDLPSGGGGGTSQGAQYQVSLLGSDPQQLQTWLPRLQAQLKKNPLLRDVGTDVDEAGLEQTLVIDRDKASRLGISVAAIDDALYNAFGQRQISTIYSDTNQYKVVLNALPSQTASPESLNRIYVPARSGRMIPISAVTRQQPGLAATQIRHQDQFTSMDLSFNLAPGVAMSEARSAIQQTIQDMRMPGDIRMELGGNFRNLSEAQSNMKWLLLAAILAVYIVLGMLYESLIHPVTILSTLPSAGVGALLALIITRTELSIVSMMALVLLIGLVKKNAIMMIDFALVAQRDGMAPAEAIREACRTPLPPDHDDHHGGHSRRTATGHRHRCRRRAAATAGHRRHRWTCRVAEPYPALQSRHLSGFREPGQASEFPHSLPVLARACFTQDLLDIRTAAGGARADYQGAVAGRRPVGMAGACRGSGPVHDGGDQAQP